MSIQRYRNDNPRTASEIVEAIEFELQQINPEAPVVQGTQNFAYINSLARVLAAQQEQSLSDLYDASYIVDASGEELTKLAREIGVYRQDAVPATGVVRFERDSPATTTRVAPSGTRVSTGGNNPATFATTASATISGPSTETDNSSYTESGTAYTVKTSFTIDVEFRESIDVSLDLATSNSSYTAYASVMDATNSTQLREFTTTNTTPTTQGPVSYDVSNYSGEITIEYRLRIADSAGTATLENATVSLGGETTALANVQCTETGLVGNVGANTVIVFVDKPAGIDTVTNPNPTGDPSYTLTDGTTPLNNGQPRENDESLRQRALDSGAIGGAGTIEALELAIDNIDEVISADVFSNRSNSTQNGIDPWHTEIRVYGGNVNDIARVAYETLPLGTLLTLQGGVNGSLDEVTLNRSDLYGTLNIPITRPVEISLSVTIDLVHDASYAGTRAAKNAIVNYVGGTTTDARTVTGLGQGDNVIVNELENVVEDITGVEAVTSSLIDDNADGTDDTTTDSDGVPVYSVTDSEVPVVAASDITINETAR